MDSRLSERDQAEIRRSAAEAGKALLNPIPPADVDRYLSPAADTPFALEYAYHLLGDVHGKTVFDLGCGHGENLVPLIVRGARVIGIDISPELVEMARQRLRDANLEASISVGSAYETGLPDSSVDAIFCMSLIHHLDIKLVRDEMWRILRPGGAVILKEPVRFSRSYGWLRGLLPAHEDVSDYEHPLTREELNLMCQPFRVEGMRFFRLPFVPLISRIMPSTEHRAVRVSGRLLDQWPALERYATIVVVRLRKAS
jgi:SAM-dependent methyltransferase